jgi:transposase
MAAAADALPEDIDALKAALVAARALASQAAQERDETAAELAAARATASEDKAQIAHLKLQIAKLQRQLFGTRSERTQRLIDQLELQLEELEASASEDEIAAEMAAAKTTTVTGFTRKRPSRQPLPAHLPRERVVEPAPCACPACGGGRLSKLGEDVTETLEVIPRRWKVIQHIREKFSCRDCEAISQAPAPFHVTPRGWAGPNFLAMLLFEKFGQHQPLNRQAERYAREGVPLSLSTLADQVGAGAAALTPIFKRIEAHVLAAERLHGDDTTVPVLAKGKTDTGRLWVYVRDDGSFAGPAPPAAVFYYSRDRRAEHPKAHLGVWSGMPHRPTPVAASATSMRPSASPHPSWRRAAGRTAAARSSNWPTSRRPPSRRRAARCPSRSIPWRSKRCSASTSSSPSSASWAACRRPSAWPCARSGARRSWPNSRPG